MSAPQPLHRAPETLPVHEVCPHCRRETDVYVVTCDGHPFDTHRCAVHGDVVPMRSAIRNRYPFPQPLEHPA